MLCNRERISRTRFADLSALDTVSVNIEVVGWSGKPTCVLNPKTLTCTFCRALFATSAHKVWSEIMELNTYPILFNLIPVLPHCRLSTLEMS